MFPLKEWTSKICFEINSVQLKANTFVIMPDIVSAGFPTELDQPASFTSLNDRNYYKIGEELVNHELKQVSNSTHTSGERLNVN